MTVRRSDGNKFLPNESWTEIGYSGDYGTFIGDSQSKSGATTPSSGSMSLEGFLNWANGQVGIQRLDPNTYYLRGQCVSLIARYLEEVFFSPSQKTVSITLGNGGDVAANVANNYSNFFSPLTDQGLPTRGAVISFPSLGHVAIVLESRQLSTGQLQVKIMDSNGDYKDENSTVKIHDYWINIPNGTANGYGSGIVWTNPK
jgi:hypothetical protein